jgi:hypothetical protein
MIRWVGGRVGFRVAVFAVVVACGAAAAVGSAAFPGTHAVRRSTSFVSLWQTNRAPWPVVEEFSLRSGRRLARFTIVHDQRESVGAPHPTVGGNLWFLTTTGPACRYPGFFECGPPVPKSCRSTLHSLDPATGTEHDVASYPRSLLVTDVVPSPTGRLAVLMTGYCAHAYFNEHFVVEDLRTGRRWTIGADARDCHGLSSPAWDATGSRLVFAYAPSALRRGVAPPAAGTGGEFCLGPKPSGIVIVNATDASTTMSWSFIAPRSGCEYTSAAFDEAGIAAFEACAPGRRGPAPDYFLGPAAFVQLDSAGRVLYRLPLELGANPGSVLSDPRTGLLLVTQNQTYRQHEPTHSFVWQLDGRHLRLIAKYPFTGEPLLAAQPW